MTGRGLGVLLMGLWATAVAVASGGVAAYVVATGLLLALAMAAVSLSWTANLTGVRAERIAPGPWEAPDGQPLRVRLHTKRPPRHWAVVERVTQHGRTRQVRAGPASSGPGTWDAVLDLAPLARGPVAMGPLRLEVRDPLALVRRRRTVLGTEQILVRPHPAPVRLPPARGVASGGTALAGAASGPASPGGPRRFRPGDPVARVHWRATARAGELLVRDEEGGGPGSLVIVLDAVTGAAEWEAAVSLAAGTVRAARGTRALLGLVTGLGTMEGPAPARRAEGRILDLLAALPVPEDFPAERPGAGAAMLTPPARAAGELVVVGRGLRRSGLRPAAGQRLVVLDVDEPSRGPR